MVELDLDAVRKILDTNVVSSLGLVQEAWRAWMSEHGGSVLFVASVAGLRSSENIGAYGVSKAAIINLTTQLAVELGPKVRVNAVAPAVVKTRFAGALYEGREAEVAAQYPAGRLGVPEDVGEAAAYLLGDGAAWVTGQTLVLDGGRLSRGDGDGSVQRRPSTRARTSSGSPSSRYRRRRRPPVAGETPFSARISASRPSVPGAPGARLVSRVRPPALGGARPGLVRAPTDRREVGLQAHRGRRGA